VSSLAHRRWARRARPAGRVAPADATARAASLARLELVVTRRLDGLTQGDHLGRHVGPGTDLADARPYAPGDDARRIDWSLSARAGDVHVRSTEPDREVETWVVADLSASLEVGSALLAKRELALAATATAALTSARGTDRVGAVLCGAAELRRVPARSGRHAAMALVATVHDQPPASGAPSPGAGLGDALLDVERTALRHGRIVVVSDFLDPVATWRPGLARLAMRHDVIAVEVRDPRDDELPAVGMLSIVDPESGRLIDVNTSRQRIRTAFADAAAERRRSIERALRSTNCTHLIVSTDRDWALDLARQIRARRTARR
jgi:uncharacterized protein (DUF58 family)